MAVLVNLDGRAAEGFGAEYFLAERPVLAAAEAGASPSLCEFDPLMTSDSDGDAALPGAAPVNMSTTEVLCVVCREMIYLVG